MQWLTVTLATPSCDTMPTQKDILMDRLYDAINKKAEKRAINIPATKSKPRSRNCQLLRYTSFDSFLSLICFFFLLFTSINILLHNDVPYTDTLPHIERSQLLHKVETVSHSLYLHNLYLPYISCSFVLVIKSTFTQS